MIHKDLELVEAVICLEEAGEELNQKEQEGMETEDNAYVFFVPEEDNEGALCEFIERYVDAFDPRNAVMLFDSMWHTEFSTFNFV